MIAPAALHVTARIDAAAHVGTTAHAGTTTHVDPSTHVNPGLDLHETVNPTSHVDSNSEPATTHAAHAGLAACAEPMVHVEPVYVEATQTGSDQFSANDVICK